jgi:probable F420-dependent oxidoreductase
MQIGVVVLPTDHTMPMDVLAAEVEQRGLSHLYVGGDHTHIPAARTTPMPGADDLPDDYRRTLDPLVALAAAAVATTSLRLGTCIHLVAQRDPITTAKQVASLDALAPGRIDFGVGYGWNVEEAADHGVEWSTRRRRVAEYVAVMRALWTEEEASFEGEFVSFERAWAWPKPETPPRVLLGASPGPRTYDAMASWADGWFPVPFWGHSPNDLTQMREAVAERGRDPEELVVVVDGVLPNAEMIDPWVGTGAEAVLVPVEGDTYDELVPALDAAAALIDRYA